MADDRMPPAPQDLAIPSPNPTIDGPPGPPRHPIVGLLNARETHLLSGASGAGKTTWVGWLMSALSSEDEIWGYKVQRPPFLGYISGDRTTVDAMEKFERAGWENPACYGVVDDHSPEVDAMLRRLISGQNDKVEVQFPNFWRALAYFRLQHFPDRPPESPLPPDSLLVVDSMAPIFGIEPAGSYLKAVGAPLLLVNRLIKREKLTLLLVHHTAKQVADMRQRYARAQDRTLGSMALLGYTSTQLVLEEAASTGRKDDLTTLTVVSHSQPAFQALYNRTEDGTFFLLEHSASGPGKTRAETPLPPAAASILDVLCGSTEARSEEGVPLRPLQLLFAEGLDERPPLSRPTFYRSMLELERRGHVVSWYSAIQGKEKRVRLILERTTRPVQ